LGLDITQGDVETHIQTTTLNAYRESVTSSHSSRASTPSVPSVIRPRPSPYQPGSRDQEIAHSLAESLNINDPMSNTLTMEVPAGTINPVTGHVNTDDAALFRAIGPDQPDPPSVSGTDRTTHIPFGWLRPQGGGPPAPIPPAPCYGRSTAVSDLDGWGFVLNVRWRKLARAGLYRSPYNGAMDKHTRRECVSSTEEDRKAGTLQSMPTQEE
jgi:hypothetical protein